MKTIATLVVVLALVAALPMSSFAVDPWTDGYKTGEDILDADPNNPWSEYYVSMHNYCHGIYGSPSLWYQACAYGAWDAWLDAH